MLILGCSSRLKSVTFRVCGNRDTIEAGWVKLVAITPWRNCRPGRTAFGITRPGHPPGQARPQPCWPCWLAADCGVRNWPACASKTFSSATAAGAWSISTARETVCARCPCRRGPKPRSTPGWPWPALPAARCWVRSTRAAALRGQGMSDAIDLRSGSPQGTGAPLAPATCAASTPSWLTKGRAPLEQIQISLGHARIQTTERYLGVRPGTSPTPPAITSASH